MVLPLAEIDWVQALAQAESSKDVAEFVREHWPEYLLRDPQGLRAHILALPEELWSNDSTLLLALASAFRECSDAHPFAVVPYLDAAAANLSADDVASGLGLQIALARAASFRSLGQTTDALSAARASSEDLAAHSALPLRSRIELQARVMFELGMALTLSGDLDAASVHLVNGLGLWDDRPPSPTVIEALGCLALVEYFCGSASSPLRRVAEARALATSSGLLERSCASPMLLAEVMIAIDEGELERADEALGGAESLARGTPYELLHLHCLAVLDGWRVGPLEQIERLGDISRALNHWQTPSLIRRLHDSTLVLALVQAGNVSAARDAIEAIPSRPEGDSHALCTGWLAARLALHTGDYEGVLALTAECRALGDHHAPRSLAFVNAVRSAAHEALGDLGSAAETTDRALLLAKRSGWRRHLTTLPPDILQSMLGSARARPQGDDAASVLDDVEKSIAPDAAGSIPPLSSRERVVLTRLMHGMTRQQISSELQVSPNTVKSQTQSIYRKLGAANRHEAIDRASKYGIS